MKIAFATDDGNTISQNYQRARYFQVITLQDGQEVERDLRAKPQQRVGDETEINIPVTGQDAGDMAEEMLTIIEDCTVLVTGGMSRPMHEKVMRYDVRPVLTNARTVNEALQEFIESSTDNPYDDLP